MHDHGNSKMMWWMMAGCLLLPLTFLLFGGRGIGSGVSWGWFALIGAFILIHILMMFGHRRSEDKSAVPSKDPVCGMKPTDNILTKHQDVTYKFCSDHCKQQFEEDPVAYV